MQRLSSPLGSPHSRLRLSLLSVLTLTLPTDHCPPWSRERPHHHQACKICSTRFHMGSVTMGSAESPMLLNSVFTLLSFFKHTIPILFPDLDHALKHTKMVKPLETAALCACRCVYAHTWQDDRVSNWKARHQQWMIIQVECMKGNLENRGQPFPFSAGKTGSIYNKGQGFVMMELSLYDIFFWCQFPAFPVSMPGHLLYPYPSSLHHNSLTLLFPSTLIPTTPVSYNSNNSIQTYIYGIYRIYIPMFLFTHMKSL